MTIIYDKINGGSYQSYSPGHGPICFVHVDCHGKATNTPVPYEICQQLTPPGWELTEHTGRIEAYRRMARLGDNLLSYGGKTYQYEIILSHDGWSSYEFYADDQKVVRNCLIRASLAYFLNNERFLNNG